MQSSLKLPNGTTLFHWVPWSGLSLLLRENAMDSLTLLNVELLILFRARKNCPMQLNKERSNELKEAWIRNTFPKLLITHVQGKTKDMKSLH